MGNESKYPKPLFACPKCEHENMTPSQRVRVGWRSNSKNVIDRKILERHYRCDKCGHKFWHEVAAKEVEGGRL